MARVRPLLFSVFWGLLIVCAQRGGVLAQDEDEPRRVETESPTPSEPQTNVYDLPRVDKSKAYFFEAFADADILEGRSRWIRSQSKKNKADAAEIEKYDGEWAIESTNVTRMEGDYALVLKSSAKHHGIAVKLDRPFVFNGKPFVFQYDVKFANGQECGGGYVKLIQQKALDNLADLNDKTPYTIMFGPDKCGKDSHLRFIFQHRNPKTGAYEEKHWKEPNNLKIEELVNSKKSHVYTLMIQPDNTFKVFIDQKIVGDGSLLVDMSPAVNPPAEIEDPNDTKPENWDERKTIPDSNAKKPDAWDEEAPRQIADPAAKIPEGWLEDEPQMIPDLNVKQPEDWDVEMDGEYEPPLIENSKCKGVGCGKWTAPLIDNPQCKSGGCGPWTAPLIDNPDYKGKWAPRKVPNPDFYEDLEPYKMTTIDALALELWSISNNVLFDSILITDNLDVADKLARETWAVKENMESTSTSLLGGKFNFKYIGIAVAVVIGLITLVTMRGKSRRQARMIVEDDDLLEEKTSEGSAGASKKKETQTVVEDDEEDADDIPPPGLEGEEGAGDNAESASAGSASEPEAEPMLDQEKETKVTKRSRARRE
ncbi:calnexin-like [Paramacrobiotus metropolitanus]|uniref:calnexin-like n=1 Tax=Paramacrobiotus metropolitanus TaxID=2943436 RepID=UPI0024458252|nr:calnexin-like [Paramacrobiotus metropolitanus]XP_055339862.1 calnexin-like [Paramacrobiotus metropolitanus]